MAQSEKMMDDAEEFDRDPERRAVVRARRLASHDDECMCLDCTSYCTRCGGMCRRGAEHRAWHTTSDKARG